MKIKLPPLFENFRYAFAAPGCRLGEENLVIGFGPPTLKMLPPSLSGGVRPRILALEQHRSEETSQQWRAVGYIMSDLTGLGIEPLIFRMYRDTFKTTL